MYFCNVRSFKIIIDFIITLLKIYIKARLANMAHKMLIMLYAAFSASNVINVPVPAITGNAKGTTEEMPSLSSPIWKILTSKTISSPKINSITAPATTKEAISIEKIWSIDGPKNKKMSMMLLAAAIVFRRWMPPDFVLIRMMIGMLPSISKTANSIQKEDSICCQSKPAKKRRILPIIEELTIYLMRGLLHRKYLQLPTLCLISGNKAIKK